MASKSTQSRGGTAAVGAEALRAEADHLIAKERFKDAVKQAKLCYKEKATPENHRLLERAYFLRSRQLMQQGMRASAVEVAQHLIDFGITGSDTPEELVRLLAALGFEAAAIAAQERLGGPELKDQVTRTVADQLVIHPDRSGSASPALVQEARRIRQALESLQSGDEAAAMEALRDLPRGSPMSEWKFFVRGLSAFEQGDDDEARANWDRLDPSRAAARIAGRLREMFDGPAGAGPAREAAETLAFGAPVLERLRILGAMVAGRDWAGAIPLLGRLREDLRRIDPALPERLTRVLIAPVIKAVQEMTWHEAKSLVKRFCNVAEPLPIDPRWSRLWALIWDGPQAEIAGAIEHWTEYLDDLGRLGSLGPAERDLARALVWNRIARLHREEGDILIDEGGPAGFARLMKEGSKRPRREPPEVVAAKKAALSALEKSLALAPGHQETYRLLAETYAAWGNDDGLEAAAKRLLERFPDDAETLQRLAAHLYGHRKDPLAALPYILRARRLQPLDERLRQLEWMAHVGAAREYALKRKWDAARAEFAAADALVPPDRNDFTYPVRKAMLEYRAGKDREAAGDRFVEQARAMLAEPGPLWLSMLVESTRYKLPKPRRDSYARLWEAELSKARRSETAGEMAGLMTAYIKAGIEYTGRATQIRKVVAYLEKTSTLKYRRQDIERVVGFFAELLPNHRRLFDKMVRAGLKQHPDSIRLHMDAADMEVLNQSFGFLFGGGVTAGTRRHLETALRLAEAATAPEDTALVPLIRERLGKLGAVEQAMNRFDPFGGMPFGRGPDDDMDDDFDEGDDDEFGDRFDESWFADFRPAPAPGRGSRKAKGRKKN